MLNLGLSNLNLSSIVGAQGLYCSYQQNPLLIGEMSPMFPTNNQGLQEAAEWGALLMDKQKLTNQVGYLAGFDSQIKSILKSDKLDESQKQRLQDVLDQVKALKEKAQKMLAKQDLKSEEIEALLGEIEELKENASEVAKEVLEEVQAAAEEAEADGAGDADDADGTDGTDDADGADGTDGTAATGATGASDGADATADEQTANSNTQIKDEAAGIVGLIYDAVDGFGTKNEQLKNTIKQINKNNIVAVFDIWNENYKNEEGTLVSRIYDDEPWYNGGNDYVKHMVDVFEEKAKELGIYSKLIKEFTIVNSELNAFWNTDNGKVAAAMETIYKTIKNTEAKKVQSIKDAKANKEAKKAEEEAKKIQEQKNQFRDDMREILGDDKAEISENVKYENKKFVIRINGKNYYGKDYLELANAIEKAGYDPVQYLKQKALNKAA